MRIVLWNSSRRTPFFSEDHFSIYAIGNLEQMISNRIKIAVHPERLAKSSEAGISFHRKYAHVVFKTLRKPLFQSFLHWIMKKESIEEHAVTNVKVMTFPFQKKNGNGLFGKCNSKGEIKIYPKRLQFCRKLKQKYGKEKLYSYVKNRARATLIHELLHLKYYNDEKQVRKLTKKYANIFARHRHLQNDDLDDVWKMLFKDK